MNETAAFCLTSDTAKTNGSLGLLPSLLLFLKSIYRTIIQQKGILGMFCIPAYEAAACAQGGILLTGGWSLLPRAQDAHVSYYTRYDFRFLLSFISTSQHAIKRIIKNILGRNLCLCFIMRYVTFAMYSASMS
jgi:hypothetical protein